MPEIAAYTAIVSIGFVILSTAVMIWFAVLGQRHEEHGPGPSEPDGEAETAE